jgi:hypothetical protein
MPLFNQLSVNRVQRIVRGSEDAHPQVFAFRKALLTEPTVHASRFPHCIFGRHLRFFSFCFVSSPSRATARLQGTLFGISLRGHSVFVWNTERV